MEPYLYAFLGWLLGGFAGGVAGFGGMMTALPVMTLGMTATDAVLTCCITGAPGCMQLAWLYRKNAVWSEMKWLWASCLPGCILGAYTLRVVPMRWLQIAISLMIAVFIVLQMMQGKTSWKLRSTPPSLCAAGFASGFANSSVSIVGVPIGIYILLTRWDKDHARSTMAMLFVMSGWITLASQGAAGLYDMRHLCWAVAGVAGSVIGQWVGFRMGRHINQTIFVKFVLTFLTAAAVLLFWKAI